LVTGIGEGRMKFSPYRLRVLAAFLLLGLAPAQMGCEACSKQMEVVGTVTDAITGMPLADVNVFCCIVRDKDLVRFTTSADGRYRYLDEGAMGGYEGARVRFEKSGYAVQYADPVTSEEGGIDRCGGYTLERNVQMNAE